MILYWISVARRAWGDAWEAVGFNRGTVVRGVFILIALAILQVIIVFFGSGGYAATDRFDQFISALQAAATVFLVLVVWYVARAAHEFDRDHRERIEEP